MKYIKELDSLRTIAIAVVIILHWRPNKHVEYLTSYIDGVAMFFVLSGFLITGILLTNKSKTEELGLRNIDAFKNFFLRRAIRIFPLYYLVVLFAIRAGYISEASGLSSYLTYTSNFYIYIKQEWGLFTHLWSLAVEEQFYFVWPWLILFIHKRYILFIIITFTITGIVSQFLLPANQFTLILTPTCLFPLGLGALVSWLNFNKSDLLAKFYPYLYGASILCIVIVFMRLYLFEFNLGHHRIITSIITTWLIFYILLCKGSKYSILSFILRNKLLIAIGKISYGLYIYHNFLPRFTINYLTQINNFLFTDLKEYSGIIIFTENLIILLCISTISWKLFEKPILSLKRYFEYSSATKVLVVPKEETVAG